MDKSFTGLKRTVADRLCCVCSFIGSNPYQSKTWPLRKGAVFFGPQGLRRQVLVDALGPYATFSSLSLAIRS
jgi:hypothetical protein